ncbi:MAG TPA: DNA replication/repair protein RecF [Chromatiales bacterium]|nr:DNA replication/repair protein RecF [Thiotrichales bacterium]HIP66966.1 DNA replication/repair protein RecF [Chromatiales bacterium]
MALSRLLLKNIRCIQSAEISPCHHFNLFYGDNGAGKTSLLEAINILSTGRSFRTHHFREVIRHEQASLMVAGMQETDNKIQQLGIERTKDSVKVRINKQPVKQIADLSFALPIIEFHPGSTELITGNPGQRRAYMDWGVFQTNADFYSDWRQYQHALKQRNALLKAKRPKQEIKLWNHPLVQSAKKVNQARYHYLTDLKNHLAGLFNYIATDYNLGFQYRSGWKHEEDFEESLEKNLYRDQTLGYTHSGPHRADLLIAFNGRPASTCASRGQLKFITILLKLLQAAHYNKATDKKAILLLDDLPSEFDQENMQQIINLIINLKTQVFITTVDAKTKEFKKEQLKMFHVKQGVVSEK